MDKEMTSWCFMKGNANYLGCIILCSGADHYNYKIRKSLYFHSLWSHWILLTWQNLLDTLVILFLCYQLEKIYAMLIRSPCQWSNIVQYSFMSINLKMRLLIWNTFAYYSGILYKQVFFPFSWLSFCLALFYLCGKFYPFSSLDWDSAALDVFEAEQYWQIKTEN